MTYESWRIDYRSSEQAARAAYQQVKELDRKVKELEAQLASVQQGVQSIKANCYSDNEGDSWRDCPDDCDFVEGLKVGDTFELQASIRAWSETFRVTKAPDDASDDYEVELVSSDAPLAPHPTQQGLDALTQAARDVIEERARQINAKGYEPDADDGYEHGELAFAAATYAVLATNAPKHTTEHLWPWQLDSLKVGEPRRMLVKAGALIQAAIEREDRAVQAKQGEQSND